jgi:hypothetical protein
MLVTSAFEKQMAAMLAFPFVSFDPGQRRYQKDAPAPLTRRMPSRGWTPAKV